MRSVRTHLSMPTHPFPSQHTRTGKQMPFQTTLSQAGNKLVNPFSDQARILPRFLLILLFSGQSRTLEQTLNRLCGVSIERKRGQRNAMVHKPTGELAFSALTCGGCQWNVNVTLRSIQRWLLRSGSRPISHQFCGSSEKVL